jgi:hypothetical protein
VALARRLQWLGAQKVGSFVYAPITAIVRFSGRKASLEFIDPLSAERITLNR